MQYTTIYDTQRNMYWGFHGAEMLDQLSFAEMTPWYDGWSNAKRGTIYDTDRMAFYAADCVEVNYDLEPEVHHYPCKDADCEYCRHIGLGLMTRNNAWDYDAKPQYYKLHEFVSFATFVEKYPLIHDHEDDTYSRDLPASFDCTDLLKIYWTYPQDEEDEEEEYDQDEEDYEYTYDDDYSEGNPHGYAMADEVDPRHYANVDNAWIAPDGTLYYVPDFRRHGTAHYETACSLGFDGTDDCERHGYIHVSSYYSRSNRFHYWPNNPTVDQKATAMAYAEATETNIPDALVLQTEDEPIKDAADIAVYTFWKRVEESCMPRSQRDRFYPLSGD